MKRAFFVALFPASIVMIVAGALTALVFADRRMPDTGTVTVSQPSVSGTWALCVSSGIREGCTLGSTLLIACEVGDAYPECLPAYLRP